MDPIEHPRRLWLRLQQAFERLNVVPMISIKFDLNVDETIPVRLFFNQSEKYLDIFKLQGAWS